MRWIKALILFTALIGIASAQAFLPVLEPGKPIERSIGAGQTHGYTVSAGENNTVQLTVEQHGVDVVVNVYSPSGKKLGEYDTPNGSEGPENVSFVVLDKGVYRIEVLPLKRDAPSGRYLIKVGEIREATDEELRASKNRETLKARALALLDETDAVIVELRSPQTRIRAEIQAASLLWPYDEKRAQRYVTDAITTFKELRTNLEPNVKEFYRSYGQVSQLRYEIAFALMNRQPEAAMNFVRSSQPPPDPYGNQRDQKSQQAGLETEINNRIARTDPKRALENARETLKSGYSQNLMETLNILREKKPELAADLAGEIAGKLANERLLNNSEAAMLAISLIRLDGLSKRNLSGDGNSQARRVLSEQQQRDLLQKLTSEANSFRPQDGGYSPEREQALNILRWLRSLGSELDGVLPGGAAALDKKLNELSGPNDVRANARSKSQAEINSLPVDEALNAIVRAPKEFREGLYSQVANRLAASGDIARARQILNEHISNLYLRQQLLGQIEQQDTYRAMSNGKIDEALRNIANLPTAEERASMIVQLVNQIGPGLKRANALNYLEQTRALLSPSIQAEGHLQMNALLEIATAFSRYDEKRAFEIVDPLVDQFNDLSDAARVLQGFSGDFYDQDELNMGNGNSVANAGLKIAETMATLAVLNFDRAKLTSDRIKRPEIRLRAYLEIAQKSLQASEQ